MEEQPRNDDDESTEGTFSRLVYLSDLQRVGGLGFEAQRAKTNGKEYARSLVAFMNVPVAEAEYDLGRDWQRFDAVIGLSDDSSVEPRLRFEVSGDGRGLYKRDVRFGESPVVQVPLSGVLRLKLVVTRLGNDLNVKGVWGDAALRTGATVPADATSAAPPAGQPRLGSQLPS